MKQVFSLLLACITLSAIAQKGARVVGNGVMKKESRSVKDFTGIESKGSMNVDITYGSASTVEVEGDENILPHIVTKVESNKLVVSTDNYSISTSQKLQVHIAMPAITELLLSGSGNITAQGNFNNEGVVHLDTRGSGDIKFQFASINGVEASVHGSGSIRLQEGKVNNLEAAVYGSGNIDAYEVSSKNVKAKTNGSGNVKVTANESLDAASNGSGNVYYKGNPTNINVKSSGSGKVVKA